MEVLLQTNLGEIKLQLESAKAPKTVRNFISYVQAGHYDGTIFHRVIDGFMIQGGGFNPKMEQKEATTLVENEAPTAFQKGLKNELYTVAMARTSAPHSASAQFFINTKNNAFLDYPGQDGWGYCVFGKVIEGMEIVDKIGHVKTHRTGMHSDVPVEPVIIEKVKIL